MSRSSKLGWPDGWYVEHQERVDVSNLTQLCFGAMLVQLIQGGSGTLRTDYPALINLLAAFFFPVGLLMLVLTGQELVTAHLSETIYTSKLIPSVHADGPYQAPHQDMGAAAQLAHRLLWKLGRCPLLRCLHG